MKFFPKKYLYAKPSIGGGHVVRLNARVRLAKSFRGLDTEGYTDATVRGYDGLVQVFLAHSALENFIKFSGLVDEKESSVKKLDCLSDLMAEHGGAEALKGCFQKDKKNLLYDFVHGRVSPRLQDRLRRCKSGESANMSYLSASIRHVFLHGDLSAGAAGLRSTNLHPLCMSVSDFVLRFIDAEFTKKVDACYKRIRAEEAKSDDSTNSDDSANEGSLE